MNTREAINLLELSLPVSEETIKKAFRAKARLYHPDNFRIYEQQIEAARYFIRVRQAYEFLLKQPPEAINRFANFKGYDSFAHSQPMAPDPRRGDVDFSGSPLFREFANLFSFFYLFRSWRLGRLFAIFRRFSPEVLYKSLLRARNKNYPVFLQRFLIMFSSVLRLMTWLLLLVIFSAFIFMLLPTLFIGALIFFPMFWFYSSSNEYLLQQTEKLLGYRPGPGSRKLAGELLYLMIRTLPVFLTDLLLAWLVYEFSGVSGIAIIFLLSGLSFFMLILSMSVVYEWIAFFRIRILRRKMKSY